MLIIMLQDTSSVSASNKAAGLHEFHTVTKLDGNEVTIADPGTDIAFGEPDLWSKYRVFLQRVPQYKDATIDASCELRSRKP